LLWMVWVVDSTPGVYRELFSMHMQEKGLRLLLWACGVN
jgi:hypothetical protein